MKNILIRGPDWVGDFVVATPVYRELRKNFPQAKIVAMVRGWTKGILENCPYVDEIIEYDSRNISFKNQLDVIKKLKNEKFDLAVLLSGNFNSALITWIAGIKNRVGYNYDKRGFLLTHCLKETGKEYRLERAVRIIESLGLKIENKKPELWLSSDDEAFAKNLISDFVKDSTVIGIGPGTQEIPKCWAPEKFVRLINSFILRDKFKVILFGSSSDIERGEKIIASIKNKDRVLNLIGRTNLNQFSACLKYVNVYVTGDTGGMHIAYTMDVPVVAIFGPTDPDEALPPKKDNIRYIWRHLECSPCSLKKSRNCKTLQCMADISVEEVYTKMEEFLCL